MPGWVRSALIQGATLKEGVEKQGCGYSVPGKLRRVCDSDGVWLVSRQTGVAEVFYTVIVMVDSFWRSLSCTRTANS